MSILQKLLSEGKLTAEDVTAIENEVAAKFQEELNKLKAERDRLSQEVTQAKLQLENEKKALEEQLQKAKSEGNLDKIKEYEAKLAEKEKQLSEMAENVKKLKVEATLNSVLDKFPVIDKELIAEAVKNKIEVTENGEIKYEGGKALEEGLKEFFDAKPHLLKAQGNSGSGSDGSGGTFKGGSKRRSEMSDVERAKFIKEHGQQAYLNLPE